LIEPTEILNVIINYWGIIILFFTVAILYSSVGFGGGSSYLAILALTSLGFIQFRAIALLCNIVVVSGGTYIYIKKGVFDYKKILPLAFLSIPMAFLGGYLKIGQFLFFILSGFTLIIAAISMWFTKPSKSTANENGNKSFLKNGIIGGVIGFISGMVGIGGGVFLAPVLHLTNWDTPKRIAATSSFFILVNSLAGLIGQYQNEDFYFDPKLAFVLMVSVFFGGQVGSRLSASRLSPLLIKRTTAILIVLVGIRILYKYLL
jgi:hypothetical protein